MATKVMINSLVVLEMISISSIEVMEEILYLMIMLLETEVMIL